MRTVLLAMAAGAFLAGAAQAKDIDATTGADAPRAEPSVKVLYICGEDEMGWRMFSRDLGIPDFVTAEQVRADTGKAWDGPKCITSAELRRLTENKSARLTPAKFTPSR